MGWGSWLLALTGPVVKRVLVSLGMGVVTYTGVALAVSSLLDAAKAAYAGSQTADVANLVAMAGVNHALAIITGAIIGRVALVSMKRLSFT